MSIPNAPCNDDRCDARTKSGARCRRSLAFLVDDAEAYVCPQHWRVYRAGGLELAVVRAWPPREADVLGWFHGPHSLRTEP